MQVTQLPHSGLIVEEGGTRLLVNPLGSPEPVDGVFTFETGVKLGALLPAQGVVISSAREHHFHLPTLAALDRDIPIFFPEAARMIGRILGAMGFQRRNGIAAGAEFALGALRVRFVPTNGGPLPSVNLEISDGARTLNVETPAPKPVSLASPPEVFAEEEEEALDEIDAYLRSRWLDEVSKYSEALERLRALGLRWELRIGVSSGEERVYSLDFAQPVPCWDMKPIGAAHAVSRVPAAALLAALKGELSIFGLRDGGFLQWETDGAPARSKVGEPFTRFAFFDLLATRFQWLLERAGYREALGDPESGGWLPANLRWRGPDIWVDWVKRGEWDFEEPFFDGTIDRHLVGAFRESTRLADYFGAFRCRKNHDPAVFIFHSSRCGSTLLCRMLEALPEFMVLSEPFVLEKFFHVPQLTVARKTSGMVATLNAFGSAMRGPEAHLAVKFAGGTHWIAWLHQIFPRTPWIYLYREPRDVIRSNLMGPPPWLLKIEGEKERFEALVRRYERQLEAALRLREGAALIANYSEINETFPARLLEALGLEPSADRVGRMHGAMHWYSKQKGTLWSDRRERAPESGYRSLPWEIPAGLREKYDALERARRARPSREAENRI